MRGEPLGTPLAKPLEAPPLATEADMLYPVGDCRLWRLGCCEGCLRLLLWPQPYTSIFLGGAWGPVFEPPRAVRQDARPFARLAQLADVKSKDLVTAVSGHAHFIVGHFDLNQPWAPLHLLRVWICQQTVLQSCLQLAEVLALRTS